jgi:hypothetical protein
MDIDPALRRQLRLSIFLQSGAGIMLAIACVVRIVTSGVDALALVFGVGALLAGGLAWYIRARLASAGGSS